MDLDSFIAKNLQQTQHPQRSQRNTSRDISQYVPQQQKTRSYGDTQKTTKLDVEPTLRKYYFGESRGEWVMNYYVDWPMGTNFKEIDQNIANKYMKQWAQEWLEARSNRGDEKYVKIEKATKDRVIFVFDVDKWMRDNFKSLRPRYKPPLTLEFHWRHDPPHFIRINSSPIDFKDFMAKKFEQWMKGNESKLKVRDFNFLKKIGADLFNYTVDFQYQEMRATLKYSVVLASLASYMIYKHGKDAPDKRELQKLKRKFGRFGDIKRLDRHIKRY